MLNGALSSSTSRFLAYELGMKNAEMLKRTFSVSLNLHMAVAFIVLLLAETIGLSVLLRENGYTGGTTIGCVVGLSVFYCYGDG